MAYELYRRHIEPTRRDREIRDVTKRQRQVTVPYFLVQYVGVFYLEHRSTHVGRLGRASKCLIALE